MEVDVHLGGTVLFGGTFDPPHLGHLVLACDACEVLQPDRFLIVPCGTPPHRPAEGVSPAGTRLEMARAAFDGVMGFEVSEVELKRPGPSWTVDTLRALAAGSDTRITLLMGADQYLGLEGWREPDVIRRLARIAVMERTDVGAGGPDAEARLARDGALRVTARRVDISSTEVRERVAEGRPFRWLLPPGVAEIIDRERLYRAPVGIRSESRG